MSNRQLHDQARDHAALPVDAEGKLGDALLPVIAGVRRIALVALENAHHFCRIAVEWAEKNPADKRAPEALHLAVKATRYGCTDKETGRWSKAAFDLLHQRYPNSGWAKETKYWFKG